MATNTHVTVEKFFGAVFLYAVRTEANPKFVVEGK
jgi:hypothetical protein